MDLGRRTRSLADLAVTNAELSVSDTLATVADHTLPAPTHTHRFGRRPRAILDKIAPMECLRTSEVSDRLFCLS